MSRFSFSSNTCDVPSPWIPRLLLGSLLSLCSYFLLDDVGLLWLLPPLRNLSWTALLFVSLGLLLGAFKRDKWLYSPAILVAVVWLTVSYSPLAAFLMRDLPEQVTPTEIAQGADAVVVLSSRIQNDGEFTPESLQRLIRGMEIVRNRQAPVLVVTEVAPPSGSSTVAAKSLAARLQMPLRLLTCPDPVRDTHDEAVALAKMARRAGWKRLFVVTSPSHTRRAALVFRHAAREASLVILPVASQEITTDLQTLDRPDERRKAFALALHERVGLQIYRWRGWI